MLRASHRHLEDIIVRQTNHPLYAGLLRFSLSIRIFLGYAAGGVDSIRLGLPRLLSSSAALFALAAICTTCTMISDTIYAFQDPQGDMKMGHKAISVLSEHRSQMILNFLSTAQVVLLLLTG